jgi:hypothetical protein
MTFKQILKKKKYELLLFGLFQHLFMALILSSLEVYRNYFWPVNMIVLGLTSFGVYLEHNKQRRLILHILVLSICSTPLLSYFIGFSKEMLIFLSISYTLFFIYIFHEVLLFLIKPSYINKDIIIASGCGYLLLIEMATFIQQAIFYIQPLAYKGLDTSHPTATFVDFVYFSSITITSIGFGDILPAIHNTKLLTSLIGIIGQFYSVVLVGILISKFTSQNNK